MAASASAVALPFIPHRSSPVRRRIDCLRGFPRRSSLSPFPRKHIANRRGFVRSGESGKVFSGEVKFADSIDEQEEEEEACELVNGVDLMIGEGDESFHAYLLKAVKNNNGAGVLLLSDVSGFEDSCTRDFAYRVACNGYNVLVPDLFHGNPWKQGQGQAQPKSNFGVWLETLNPERVARCIDLSTEWLVGEFASAGVSEKLALIGFCYGGGRLIETLARDDQSRFATGVCFYGSRMDPAKASRIRVPVLLICGDDDRICEVSVVREIERAIEGSKLVIYVGRGHGFVHRPESQEEDQDAEQAFGIMRGWLHDFLLVN